MHFFEYGKQDGIPLVFFLGTPHTGDSVAELADLATETGIRLICPTRSWYLDATIAPSFEACTVEVIRYLKENQVGRAVALGGSGGGPFALHLTSSNPDVFEACYLLASMGEPEVFRRTVKSSHTRMLLQLIADHDYERALAQLADWGIPAALAHGVWADLKVLLGSWETVDVTTSVRVYIHHGEDDDNAPLESIRALSAKLINCQVRISPTASHLGLANDKEFTEFRTIFTEIGRQYSTQP